LISDVTRMLRFIRLLSTWLVIVVGGVRSADADAPALRLTEATLAPMGHTIFCQANPIECSEMPGDSAFSTTSSRDLHRVLDIVNRQVNSAIMPIPMSFLKFEEDRWLLSPLFGNCKDFAVSKRHQLLRMGWPSSALLLAEVTVRNGEHHLVLVATVRGESFVLDNLEPYIVPLTSARDYQWKRIESPRNSRSWVSVGRTI
jgi:predicted transglutaminase-like cysteine proteinase